MFGGLGLLMNFAMYWFSDRIALMAHRAQEVIAARGPHAARHGRAGWPPGPGCRCRGSTSSPRRPTPSPPAATRPRRGGGHRGHPADARRARAGRRAGPRAVPLKNRDILIATIAAGVAGLISSIGHVLQWGSCWRRLARRRRSRRRPGRAGLDHRRAHRGPAHPAGHQPFARVRRRRLGRGADAAIPTRLADALVTLEQGQARPYDSPAPPRPTCSSSIRCAVVWDGSWSCSLADSSIEERVRRLRALGST